MEVRIGKFAGEMYILLHRMKEAAELREQLRELSDEIRREVDVILDKIDKGKIDNKEC